MMKKDRQKVILFIKALRENGQDRLADRLQNSFGIIATMYIEHVQMSDFFPKKPKV